MIRLLLVDDQDLICQGLKAMLALELDLHVVGTARNGKEALEQVAALQPDVVLMDIQMPVMDGREATRKICEQFPDIHVLVLSTFDDDQYIAQSIRAGAKGYLLKDMPSEELAQAIRLVHRGYTQLGPGLMEKLIISLPDSDTFNTVNQASVALVQQELAKLTAREREVLHLLGSGLPNREIAQKLYITEGTVKTYVTHLLNRLNLRNRAQIAIYANSILSGTSRSSEQAMGRGLMA
jgi:DNA-binding NarL/FixJ family response regulator